MIKRDIEGREDIQTFVDRFYERVQADEVIGYLFNDVAQVNWQAHLPVMYAFWEQVIFQTGNFSGNPMLAHQKLHAKSPLCPAHFERWILLFTHTVQELFSGKNATLALQRAKGIATIMEHKVLNGGIGTV